MYYCVVIKFCEQIIRFSIALQSAPLLWSTNKGNWLQSNTETNNLFTKFNHYMFARTASDISERRPPSYLPCEYSYKQFILGSLTLDVCSLIHALLFLTLETTYWPPTAVLALPIHVRVCMPPLKENMQSSRTSSMDLLADSRDLYFPFVVSVCVFPLGLTASHQQTADHHGMS